MILVIGGRSRTGRELIRLLREAGAPLRILTRTAQSPDDPGAVPGDLVRPDTLDAAMTGAEKVFLLCSAAHDELAWHRHAIGAAARAGVSHLVRSSILGADPASAARFIRHHGQADQHLRGSGCRTRSCGRTSTCTTCPRCGHQRSAQTAATTRRPATPQSA